MTALLTVMLAMLMPRCMTTPMTLSAGDDEDDRDDDAAVAGGAATPVWPLVDATLAQLEDWLESLRRLPKDDAILARQGALSRRVSELRTPLPAARASPLTFVLGATRATDM